MSKLACYIDGSQVETENRTFRQGWGVVARHILGNSIEINGFVEHHINERHLVGFYEVMAFYHAVLHAEQHGILPEETSFYTDCSWVAYSGFHLIRSNRSGMRYKIYARLKKFQKRFCPEDKHAILKIMRWLAFAQIHWVKGHSRLIDNCRADYLARQAVKEKKVLPFNKWINHGFAMYDRTLEQDVHWFPAFVKTEE